MDIVFANINNQFQHFLHTVLHYSSVLPSVQHELGANNATQTALAMNESVEQALCPSLY